MTDSLTDRELLQYAAKAVGLHLSTEWDCAEFGILVGTGNGDLFLWHPLADDGAALRLAVQLKMLIDDIRKGYRQGYVVAVSEAGSFYERREPDPFAATRRAIVRAAAEVGMSLKEVR